MQCSFTIFKNDFGFCRRIVYILSRQDLNSTAVEANRRFGLGSDHRCVTVVFDVSWQASSRGRKFKSSKGWIANLDENKQSIEHHKQLDESLNQ